MAISPVSNSPSTPYIAPTSAAPRTDSDGDKDGSKAAVSTLMNSIPPVPKPTATMGNNVNVRA